MLGVGFGFALGTDAGTTGDTDPSGSVPAEPSGPTEVDTAVETHTSPGDGGDA